MFPEGQDYEERPIVPSEGRVRAVRVRPGLVQFQDPDEVIERTYADGRIVTIRNQFIAREQAIPRLHFDFQVNRIRDSFGRFVGVAHLKVPAMGRVVDFVELQARYRPLTIDPRRYDVRENEEIIERLVLLDREGNIVTRETSYGLGQKYDRARRGKWFFGVTRDRIGVETGKKVETRELEKAVLSREFIVKRIGPRG